jgi:glycosyltransferase involved in cell wall biosynthesis
MAVERGASGAPGPAAAPVILQLLPALEGGGVERETVDIAHAIARAGFTALVVSSGGKMVAELEAGGARHITLPIHSKNPSHILENGERLAQLIAEQGVSLVHARSRAPAWAGYLACKRTGTPFVTTFHGTYSVANPFIRQYNSVMARGARVIAVSDFIADHIREHYPIAPGQLTTIHRGIDLEQYDPARVDAARVAALRARWEVPAGVRSVMLPGRLTWLKGQYVLIQALAQLADLGVLCLLVGAEYGGTHYTQNLMRQAQRRGVEARVRFTGECADMPAAYALCDAVVSASVAPEAFGRVLAEAFALGKPVISTDHGGGKEIVETCQAGWLVRVRDPEALAMGIRQALDLSPAALGVLGARASATARRCYDMREMCGKTLNVYRELLGLDSLASKRLLNA